MRIERTGTVEPLTPRVVHYLLDGLNAKRLDDLISPEQKRPDFSCFNGILIIEMKTLKEDGSRRMENLNDELRNRSDYPTFFGKVPVESLIKNMNDQDDIRRKISNRFGRAIVDHLRKAKEQLAAYATENPRKNLVKIVVLINEDHEIYDPDTVQFTIRNALNKRENSKLIYEDIDGVIYMTERHAVQMGSQIAYPLLNIENDGIIQNPWKELFVRRFLEGWADWNKAPSLKVGTTQVSDFETIDHVPDKMPRHEFWRLEYRRNPYMQYYSDEMLRNQFDESNVLDCLAMSKGAPLKLSQQTMLENMRWFTHILVEINQRGIPMQKMELSIDRALAACERLKLPPEAVTFIRRLETTRDRQHS